MKATYLIDGKPHRECDCSANTATCPRGRERTCATAGFNKCFLPAPDVLLAQAPLPEPDRKEDEGQGDTPRTDEQLAFTGGKIDLVGSAFANGYGQVDAVPAEFARNLERELATLRLNYEGVCAQLRGVDGAARSMETRLPEAAILVPCSERLPDHGEDVLFVTSTGFWLGWRDAELTCGGGWKDHFDDSPICNLEDATHWMPLPVAPRSPLAAPTKKENL